MSYIVEARNLVEVGIPSLWRQTYNPKENHTLMYYELDLLEEKRDLTTLRNASYKRWFERYFNFKVKKKVQRRQPSSKKDFV